MVLKGPSNAKDLNVLQGKAYEKPCWPQYIRDQYVLKGPHYNLEMNLNPLSIYICLTSLTRAKPKEKMEFPA